MKILFLCVNYNSYRELNDFCKSVKLALAHAPDSIEVEFHVADNTEVAIENILNIDDVHWRVHSWPLHQNIGYLPALEYMMAQLPGIREGIFDFVVFSNVDVLVSEDFFSKLAGIAIPPDTGWIAPSIKSEYEKRDRNPGMIRRPTRLRLELCWLMFRLPFLYRCYHRYVYQQFKGKKKTVPDFIYAGHGSFMIFTRKFMKNYPSISYPGFLFCEEIFLAEVLRRCGLKCIYRPEIQITDIDHISTSKMDAEKYFKSRLESLDAVIRLFFHFSNKVNQ